MNKNTEITKEMYWTQYVSLRMIIIGLNLILLLDTIFKIDFNNLGNTSNLDWIKITTFVILITKFLYEIIITKSYKYFGTSAPTAQIKN